MSIPDKEFLEIFSLFSNETILDAEVINTSRDESDFRETVIVSLASGGKLVIKLCDNDFTYPEQIESWRRCAEEYRTLGYYCPKIMHDKSGTFPAVRYKGRSCFAYAEEFSPYKPLEDRMSDPDASGTLSCESCERDIWTMTAKAAAKRFDFTDHPSAYCLFETFSPSDKTDEVLENAQSWLEYAKTLPEKFQPQIDRIWQLWNDNRSRLEPLYKKLPTSVLQADLNSTNILLDDEGKFVGVYDFNLSGREVFLNYIFRELFADFDKELEMIFRVLKIVRETYVFSEEEKQAALLLYRCLKPLWTNKLDKLKKLGTDKDALQSYLDRTEQALTEEIDLRSYL